MKGKRCRKNRERERKTCGWRRLLACSGVVSSGTASNDVAGSGAADNEKCSVVGMKMGRERKENVKKERKWKKKEKEEKRKEKAVSG